jgi:hypothetical protein
MATSANPPGGENSGASNDQKELFKFLREQSEANRLALQQEVQANRAAQREDAEAVRRLFTTTSAIVAIPLAVALTLAGIFWFKDMNSMKEQLEKEGKAAEQVEIEKMDAHIDATLQQQFTTKAMQDRIDRAAEQATEGKAKGLIEDRVRAITEPIQQRAQAQIASIHIQELIARVNADDAEAFDELLQLRDKGDDAQQGLIQRVVADKIRNDFLLNLSAASTPASCELSSESFRKALASSDGWIRKGAVEKCLSFEVVSQWLRGDQQSFDDVAQIAPLLANLGLNDPSLVVRHQAIESFDDLFHSSPTYPSSGLDLLDSRQLSKWWGENKPSFKELLLLSIAKTPQPFGLNTIRLYDEVKKVGSVAPPSLRRNFESALEGMRSSVIQHNSDTRDSLIKNMGRSDCADVRRDFTARLNTEFSWSDMSRELQQQSSPDYGMWELQYLRTCPSDTQLLMKVAAVMANTHFLERRYRAAMVVNKWTGSNLDPFDSSVIQEWWKQHKGTLEN